MAILGAIGRYVLVLHTLLVLYRVNNTPIVVSDSTAWQLIDPEAQAVTFTIINSFFLAISYSHAQNTVHDASDRAAGMLVEHRR